MASCEVYSLNWQKLANWKSISKSAPNGEKIEVNHAREGQFGGGGEESHNLKHAGASSTTAQITIVPDVYLR